MVLPNTTLRKNEGENCMCQHLLSHWIGIRKSGWILEQKPGLQRYPTITFPFITFHPTNELRISSVPILQFRVLESLDTSWRSGQYSVERCIRDCVRQESSLMHQIILGREGIQQVETCDKSFSSELVHGSYQLQN